VDDDERHTLEEYMNLGAWKRITRPAGPVMIALGCLASAAEAVTFSDSTFADSDWSAALIFDSTTSGASFSAMQVGTGGNPGEFRATTHDWTGPGGLAVGHFQSGAAYDPTLNGQIVSITVSFDLLFLGGSTGTSQVGHGVLLEQNGSLYLSGPNGFGVALGPGNGLPGAWMPFAFSGLTASDFQRLSGPGPAAPDFSSAGGLIRLGYFTTNGSGPTVSTRSGIDNWSFTIVSGAIGPGPASEIPTLSPWLLALFGFALAGTAIFLIRRS
jgi:hypothetical protein